MAVKLPNLINEWDYTKNGTLLPSNVSIGSDKKVWWICDKGHSYISSIYSKTRGRGCPVCAGKVVLKGYNDFATHFPDLLNEWDIDKNEQSPFEVSYGSDKKYWWKCSKGHSYEQSISCRKSSKGCPFCFGKKATATTP